MTRTYSELIKLKTFEERFEYLKLSGVVGRDTFGYERYLNQKFYRSPEWKKIRNEIIIRDNGCDLAIEDRPIQAGLIYIHHMNPLRSNDIIDRTEYLTNPEFLICVTYETHNAIHYGDISNLFTGFVTRTKNDTCPWKR